MKNKNRLKSKKLSLNKIKVACLNKTQLKKIYGGDTPPLTIHTEPTAIAPTTNCGG